MVKKIVIFFVVIVLLTVSCSKNAPVPLEKIDCIGKQLRIDGYSAGLIGGFSAGLAPSIGALSGGAINGCGMALLCGESFKNVLINTGIGAATGWLGGISGNYAGKLGFMINNVRSPLLNGLIGGSIGGAAGGYVGGFTNGLIRTGQFSDAHDAGMNGLLSGMATGAITGSVAGLKYAHDNKIRPWSGKSNEKGDYTVYKGTNAEGDTKYIGITKRAPQVRFDEHYSSGTERGGLKYEPIESGLTRTRARIMEQNFINKLA